MRTSVLASPSSRDRRRPILRTPCESVASHTAGDTRGFVAPEKPLPPAACAVASTPGIGSSLPSAPVPERFHSRRSARVRTVRVVGSGTDVCATSVDLVWEVQRPGRGMEQAKRSQAGGEQGPLQFKRARASKGQKKRSNVAERRVLFDRGGVSIWRTQALPAFSGRTGS